MEVHTSPTSTATPITVAIVDDHPVVRQGLAALFADDQSVHVVGTAGTIAEAVDVVLRTGPSVAIIDLSLGHESGLDLIAVLRTRAPGVRFLVLSALDELGNADRALRAGAHGYIEKAASADTLLAAVHRVAEGRTWVSDATAERILSGLGGPVPRQATGDPFEGLSDRERHVVQLIGAGLATREIARELKVAFKTVEAHYAHIKRKAGIRTGRELTRMAVLWVEGSLHH